MKVARSDCAAVRDGVINQEDHYRTDDCNYHAPDIETGYSGCAKKAEQDATDDCADNAERHVEQHAFALLVDDLTPDKASNKPEYDTTDDGHRHSPSCAIV